MAYKDPEKRRENHKRYMRDVWYPKNKQKHIELVNQTGRNHRAFIREAKRDKTCKYCPETEPCCLDFHHRDASQKKIGIAQIVTAGWGRQRIIEEMDKCDLVCSNCHKKLHAGVLKTEPGRPTGEARSS